MGRELFFLWRLSMCCARQCFWCFPLQYLLCSLRPDSKPRLVEQPVQTELLLHRNFWRLTTCGSSCDRMRARTRAVTGMTCLT